MPDTIMNEKEYFSIMTQAGSIYMADAAAEERLVNPKYIAVGDAGGIPYQPNVFMTGLKNQCWIGEIIEKVKDADNPDIVEFRTILPSDVGGFTVREVAVITDDGTTLFLANHPDAMKVLSSSGASNEFPINIRCLFTSAENVDMQVDPNVAVASRQWVENRLVQEFEAHNGDPDAHPGIQAGIEEKVKQHNDDGDAHPAINSKITELAGDGINAHNTDATAHVAIREKIGTDIAAHNAAADTHQDIRTSLGNVYTKAETDSALASKANSGDVYSKLEIDGITAGKANAGYCQIIYNHDIMGEKYEDPEYGCFRIVDQFGMVHVSLFGYTKEGFEVKQGDTLLTLPQEIAPRYHFRVPVVILTRLGGSLGFACAIHEGNGWMTLYVPNGIPANARGIIGQFWYQLF